MDQIKSNRLFMKSPSFADEKNWPATDQQRDVPHPPLGKPATNEVITLTDFSAIVPKTAYADLLDSRRSLRSYAGTPVTQEQLAFLLWSANGIQAFRGKDDHASFRPVPSGGARHPFEIYIAAQRVESFKSGLYHYLPTLNAGKKIVSVERIGDISDYAEEIPAALADQNWTAHAPLTLLITCVPYRAEWRYRDVAHRVMLIDLGHLGQNVMLSAAALGLGSCCLAAYESELCDKMLRIDGINEYTVYAVTIGAPKNSAKE